MAFGVIDAHAYMLETLLTMIMRIDWVAFYCRLDPQWHIRRSGHCLEEEVVVTEEDTIVRVTAEMMILLTFKDYRFKIIKIRIKVSNG